jgi:tellurite resistance protein tehB homolog
MRSKEYLKILQGDLIMQYMGNCQWWNDKFKSRKLQLMRHEKCLEEDIKYFPRKGKILDIACGDGRNSIYLARLGYVVHAIDFSEEALNRLNYFAEKENLNIETQLGDLSENNFLNNLYNYDAIIINHYRLRPELYSILMKHIKENGVLWINGFKEIPSDNPNITELDILREEDLIDIENYHLENKKTYSIGERTFIRYIWRK